MDRLPRMSQITMSPAPSHDGHSVAEWISDILGATSIFATGYLLLLIGHGLGLN